MAKQNGKKIIETSVIVCSEVLFPYNGSMFYFMLRDEKWKPGAEDTIGPNAKSSIMMWRKEVSITIFVLLP